MDGFFSLILRGSRRLVPRLTTTSGAKAPGTLCAGRGAEAPLFHGLDASNRATSGAERRLTTTSGAKAPGTLRAGRGAKAPLFHGLDAWNVAGSGADCPIASLRNAGRVGTAAIPLDRLCEAGEGCVAFRQVYAHGGSSDAGEGGG